jgi:hypothetical protein
MAPRRGWRAVSAVVNGEERSFRIQLKQVLEFQIVHFHPPSLSFELMGEMLHLERIGHDY